MLKKNNKKATCKPDQVFIFIFQMITWIPISDSFLFTKPLYASTSSKTAAFGVGLAAAGSPSGFFWEDVALATYSPKEGRVKLPWLGLISAHFHDRPLQVAVF